MLGPPSTEISVRWKFMSASRETGPKKNMDILIPIVYQDKKNVEIIKKIIKMVTINEAMCNLDFFGLSLISLFDGYS